MPSIASGFTSAGAMIGVSPCSAACAIARLTSAELQQRADAGEEVEPGAGDLGAALGVDRPSSSPSSRWSRTGSGVVGHVADLLQHDGVVLAAGRHAVGDDVGDGPVRGRGRPRRPRPARPRRPGRRRPAPWPARSSASPLLAGGPRHLLGDRLLLGAQRVGGGHRRAPPLVRGEQGVDQRRVVAAGALRGADPVGVVRSSLEVDHPSQGTGAGQARCAAPSVTRASARSTGKCSKRVKPCV